MTITKSVPKDEDLKYYRLSEVALRDGKSSDQAWIVVKDCIYDVTTYAESHPGGPELVLEFAGKDCTKAFNDAGHSSDAWKQMKGLKIGELVDEDKKANRGKIQTVSKTEFVESDTKKKRKLGGFLFC